MNNVATSTRTQLAARELVALDNAEGLRIECVSGELWITTEGGAGDLIVVAGESIELQGISRAYISALRPAGFVVTQNQTRSPVRQLAARCAAKLYDTYRRWQHAPVAAMPVVWLR